MKRACAANTSVSLNYDLGSGDPVSLLCILAERQCVGRRDYSDILDGVAMAHHRLSPLPNQREI
jgi:hypothetical protein